MALDARRTVCGWGERAAFWLWWVVLADDAGCDGRRDLGVLVLAGPGEDAVEVREAWRGRGCTSLCGMEDALLPWDGGSIPPRGESRMWLILCLRQGCSFKSVATCRSACYDFRCGLARKVEEGLQWEWEVCSVASQVRLYPKPNDDRRVPSAT